MPNDDRGFAEGNQLFDMQTRLRNMPPTDPNRWDLQNRILEIESRSMHPSLPPGFNTPLGQQKLNQQRQRWKAFRGMPQQQQSRGGTMGIGGLLGAYELVNKLFGGQKKSQPAQSAADYRKQVEASQMQERVNRVGRVDDIQYLSDLLDAYPGDPAMVYKLYKDRQIAVGQGGTQPSVVQRRTQ